MELTCPVVGMFEERKSAETAVDALWHAGFRHDQVGYLIPGRGVTQAQTGAAHVQPRARRPQRFRLSELQNCRERAKADHEHRAQAHCQAQRLRFKRQRQILFRDELGHDEVSRARTKQEHALAVKPVVKIALPSRFILPDTADQQRGRVQG